MVDSTMNKRNVHQIEPADKLDMTTLFGGLEVTDEDVKDVKDAEFIIPKLIVRGQSTVFIAEPNCGKTAVLVHLAPQIESPRVFRRPSCLSHATMADS